MTPGRRKSQRKFDRRPGLFPSPEQLLVLRASLGSGAPALDAYRQWRAMLDLAQEFDRGVFRLIPLLYDNLRKLGHQDDLTGRLKGAYRMAWAKNHRLFEEARPLIDALQTGGVRVMAVKGAPIGFQYYRNPALRPMADVDLVVPLEDLERAVLLLQQLGFLPWWPFGEDVKRYRHAMPFTAPGPRELDLHWHMLLDLCDRRSDELFWRTARPFEFMGRTICAPDATRLLVHTILHGLRWNDEPPVRWIPDSVTILRTAGSDVDWAAVVDFAETHAVAQRLLMGLSYLAEEFEAEVPAATLDRLARIRPRFVERVEQRTILRRVRYESAFGPVLEALAHFPGLRGDAGPVGKINDFSHFLRFHWHLRGRSEIPGRICQGVARRARSATSRLRGLPA